MSPLIQATEQDEEDYISELTAQYDKTFQDFLDATPEFDTQGIDDDDEVRYLNPSFSCAFRNPYCFLSL